MELKLQKVPSFIDSRDLGGARFMVDFGVPPRELGNIVLIPNGLGKPPKIGIYGVGLDPKFFFVTNKKTKQKIIGHWLKKDPDRATFLFTLPPPPIGYTDVILDEDPEIVSSVQVILNPKKPRQGVKLLISVSHKVPTIHKIRYTMVGIFPQWDKKEVLVWDGLKTICKFFHEQATPANPHYRISVKEVRVQIRRPTEEELEAYQSFIEDWKEDHPKPSK